MNWERTFKPDDIFEALVTIGCAFEVHGTPSGTDYSFKSLRNPGPDGVYYAVGDYAKNVAFERSITVTDADIDPLADCAVVRVAAPQVVYYRLMNHLFPKPHKPGVHPTAILGEDVEIHPEASIGPYCCLDGCTVGAGAVLHSHVTVVPWTVIEESVTIESQSTIGAGGVAWVWDCERQERVVQPQIGNSRIGARSFLGAGTIVVRGSVNETTVVGKDCVIAPGCKIGHGCEIGDGCHFANNIAIGGNSILADHCFLGVASSIRPQVRLARQTIVAAGAVVVKSCLQEGRMLVGVPATEREQPNRKMSGVPSFT